PVGRYNLCSLVIERQAPPGSPSSGWGRAWVGDRSRRMLTMIDTARSEFPADMVRAAQVREHPLESLASGLLDALKDYAREKPAPAALWALGSGFVLGWKLKPGGELAGRGRSPGPLMK